MNNLDLKSIPNGGKILTYRGAPVPVRLPVRQSRSQAHLLKAQFVAVPAPGVAGSVGSEFRISMN